MLNKFKTLALVFIVGAVLSSCSITLPLAATSNPVGSKVGTATATGFLGILFFDADASIKTAAQNGGISRISTVDIKYKNVLNILTSYETIITGE